MKKLISILVLLVIITVTFLVSRSGKITIEESIQDIKGTMSWSREIQSLSAADLQDDAVINVIYGNHDTYGVIRKLNNDKNPLIEIDFYSGAKKQIAKIKEQWQYDIAFPEYLVASDGKILAIDVSNRIRFFDQQGDLINTFKIIENYYYSSEAIIVNDVSTDFDLLFTGMTIPGKGSSLILRTIDNTILLEQNYQGWSVRNVAMSNDKKYLAVSLYQSAEEFKFRSFIMNKEGDILYESDQRSSSVQFASNFAAIFDKKRLELIDLSTMQQSGEYILPENDPIIVAADFSDTGVLMIQTAEVSRNNNDSFNPWQYVNNKLTTLDMKAEALAQLKFENEWVVRPSLWYDASRQQFFYGHTSGYHFISAEQ